MSEKTKVAVTITAYTDRRVERQIEDLTDAQLADALRGIIAKAKEIAIFHKVDLHDATRD